MMRIEAQQPTWRRRRGGPPYKAQLELPPNRAATPCWVLRSTATATAPRRHTSGTGGEAVEAGGEGGTKEGKMGGERVAREARGSQCRGEQNSTAPWAG